MKPNTMYEFGPFRLDTIRRSLICNEQLIQLQPKTYAVLLMLIQNRDRVVTRDELIEKVWDVNVSDGALNFQINQLRKILNDNATKPIYIQTYAKYGFQFISEVIESYVRKEEIEGKPTEEQIIYEEKEEPVYVQAAQSPGQLSSKEAALDASAGTRLLMGGHIGHILASCLIYAALYGIAVLIEIAYKFDHYGPRALTVAFVTFCWIFVTSFAGLSLIWKLESITRRMSLFLGILVFLVAAGLLFAALCQFLPATPITQLKIQAYTAQAAYLKDMYYFLAMAFVFLIIPFHFVISVQRELEDKRSYSVLTLLSGNKLSVPPKGTLYIRLYILGGLLLATVFAALYLHSHLLDNLNPGTYMNLFIIFIYVRLILYLGLGMLCLFWYYGALNDLKRECLEMQSLGVTQETHS